MTVICHLGNKFSLHCQDLVNSTWESVISETLKILVCNITYHTLSGFGLFRVPAVRQVPCVYHFNLNKKTLYGLQNKCRNVYYIKGQINVSLYLQRNDNILPYLPFFDRQAKANSIDPDQSDCLSSIQRFFHQWIVNLICSNFKSSVVRCDASEYFRVKYCNTLAGNK